MKLGADTSPRFWLGMDLWDLCREAPDTPPNDGIVTLSRHSSENAPRPDSMLPIARLELRDLADLAVPPYAVELANEGADMSARFWWGRDLWPRLSHWDIFLPNDGALISSRHSLGMESRLRELLEAAPSDGMLTSSRHSVALFVERDRDRRRL